MSFIYFGCWNNNFCDTEKLQNGLSNVMNKLQKFNFIDFIILAGDNNYPIKKIQNSKKIKEFNEENFYSGVNCLTNALPLNKKYILLGNHEFDLLENINKNEKCGLMNIQKNTFNKDNYIFFENVMIEKLNNTIIIMIDTTLYEMKDNIDLYCHNVFPLIERDYEKLCEEQKRQIINILKSNLESYNIIIIGHHPIISIKKNKNSILEGLIKLFNDIKEFIKDKNIYYLCADNHLQQEGIITFNDIEINQYVAGTGGADLDECPENYINPIELIYKFHNIDYKIDYIINQCKSTYGFYLIEEINNELQFNFIDIDIDKNIDVYKNKYLKYKNKYLKYKNKLKYYI